MQRKNYVEPILKTIKLHALLTLLAVNHHLRANGSDPEIFLESECKCPLDCFHAGKKRFLLFHLPLH